MWGNIMRINWKFWRKKEVVVEIGPDPLVFPSQVTEADFLCIIEHVQAGKKVNAIKHLHRVSGMDLRESKTLIDKLIVVENCHA